MTGGGPRSVELEIDVTGAAGLGEAASVAATVHLPDGRGLSAPSDGPPVVCFARPGAGLGRHYFTIDLPGPAAGVGAQAEWHAARGWVFVSVDHLGIGSSTHHDGEQLGFATMTATAAAADRGILDLLAAGAVDPWGPPVRDPVVLGLGHSMGGGLAISQQARHRSFDGLAVLGQSAVFNDMPAGSASGASSATVPWRTRDARLDDPAAVLNAERVRAAATIRGERDTTADRNWAFHYDDVDVAGVGRGPWITGQFLPAVMAYLVAPGALATEAAAVDVPVLAAMGERDVVVDPKGEPRAYLSAAAVDLFVCPRTAHLHNFSGNRELFWQRIAAWGEWVRTYEARRRTHLSGK